MEIRCGKRGPSSLFRDRSRPTRKSGRQPLRSLRFRVFFRPDVYGFGRGDLRENSYRRATEINSHKRVFRRIVFRTVRLRILTRLVDVRNRRVIVCYIFFFPPPVYVETRRKRTPSLLFSTSRRRIFSRRKRRHFRRVRHGSAAGRRGRRSRVRVSAAFARFSRVTIRHDDDNAQRNELREFRNALCNVVSFVGTERARVASRRSMTTPEISYGSDTRLLTRRSGRAP